jgi:hypothetical protein
LAPSTEPEPSFGPDAPGTDPGTDRGASPPESRTDLPAELAPSTEPESSSGPEAPGTDPATDRGVSPSASGSEEDRGQTAARRFARLVATDIRLYNEDSVLLGRRHGDLGQRLREQMERGKETFERRFPDLGEDGDRILREAFVQVLAGGDPELLVAGD